MITTTREDVLLFGYVPAIRLHFMQDGVAVREPVDFKPATGNPLIARIEREVAEGKPLDQIVMHC